MQIGARSSQTREAPLAESPMKDHPLTPMHESNLLHLMTAQSSGTTGLIPASIARQGVDAIHERMAALTTQGLSYAAIDALKKRPAKHRQSGGEPQVDHRRLWRLIGQTGEFSRARQGHHGAEYRVLGAPKDAPSFKSRAFTPATHLTYHSRQTAGYGPRSSKPALPRHPNARPCRPVASLPLEKPS